MKLLIVTQKVDRKDPILGFFHRWIEEFAQHCEEVHVIGQLVGEVNLPANVHVYSLGKENGVSIVKQIVTFWRLQRTIGSRVNAVFVHMTPIWVVLNLFSRTPQYLWYEARGTRWPLRVALLKVRKVFSASANGMPLCTKKSVITGHGIDLNLFTPGGEKEEGLLITVGRITRSKHLEVLLEALSLLPEKFHLRVCGNVITDDDKTYNKELDQRWIDRLSHRVGIGAVSQSDLIPLLQKAQVFVHASETPLDKAVLEALACGCLVVSTAQAVQPLLPEYCRADSVEEMAKAVERIADLSEEQYRKEGGGLREYVKREHELHRLIEKLMDEMQQKKK